MHQLIVRYFNGELTEEEKKLLFSMMDTDADLRKEFVSAQNLGALTSCLPQKEDTIEGLNQLSVFKQTRIKKTFRIPYIHILGYAASICIAIFSTWMLMQPEKIQNVSPVTYEEFITPSGQRAMVRLHDGTTVWLNARSVLKYPNRFENGERKVELNGEAFFEVAHDAKNPFIVSTEDLDIKVLGTKFNVFAYKGRKEFNTSLVEGSVKIYHSKDEEHAVSLKPNERVDLVGNKLIKRNFDSMDFLLWRDGIYSFDDVSFAEIINKLELYYDINIEVKKFNLNAYKFSGKFRQRDGVENVLHTLRKVKYFSYVKDEEHNKITIR